MIIITVTAPAGHSWEGTRSYTWAPGTVPQHLVSEPDRSSVAAQLGLPNPAGSPVSWDQYTAWGGT